MPSHSHPTVSFTVTGETRETPLESLREIWRFRALIVELVQRDLRIRYKKRVGGILWSLLPALMQVAIISLMVKLFLKDIEGGVSGYLLPVVFLWEFFKNTILDSAQSMVLNAQLARKFTFRARFADCHVADQSAAFRDFVRVYAGLFFGQAVG